MAGGPFFLFFFPHFLFFILFQPKGLRFRAENEWRGRENLFAAKKMNLFDGEFRWIDPLIGGLAKKKRSGSQSGAPVGGSNTVVQWNFKKYLKKNKRNTQRFASPLEINWKFWWRQVSNKSSRKKERKKERKKDKKKTKITNKKEKETWWCLVVRWESIRLWFWRVLPSFCWYFRILPSLITVEWPSTRTERELPSFVTWTYLT